MSSRVAGVGLFPAGHVEQVSVPCAARSLSMLERIDYADAFLLEVGTPARRPAEQWAREILCGAPPDMRAKLLAGWSAIGLRMQRSGPTILGWTVRKSTREFVLLGAGSRIGMPGELLFRVQSEALLFCTFVGQHSLVARATWAATKPLHLPTVRSLLSDAGRRLARG
jgi:hypothetical protein